ncbi:PaaI family thioesterase [Roseibium sp. RKSG952]|uniref:PaaI family thioesterase n=1 Tax=Roseibium sp. RKSG952 TaxID=2529384 RepID=UPI0012BCE3F4|nr:PaaI family thioesterase [Roseibium sp. RKSG952]MTH95974.1 PaaI family thioesterase [Roseibium sp. RKSG952]
MTAFLYNGQLLPLLTGLGGQVEIEPETGTCSCTLPLSDTLLNRHGVVHGGVLATLLDTASGFTASLAADGDASHPCMTLSLNIDYPAAARHGPLRAIGTRVGGGNSISFVTGKVFDGRDELVAMSTGVFKRLPTNAMRGTA